MRVLLLASAAILLGPAGGALADQFDDYLAAGFQPVLTTLLPGTFTGCVKDQVYTFSNNVTFVCNEKRAAFALRPRVLLLASADGSERILLIGGRPYVGSVSLAGHGIRSNPVTTVGELPDEPSAPKAGTAVGAIVPIEALTPIKPLPDNAKLHETDVQRYAMPRQGS